MVVRVVPHLKKEGLDNNIIGSYRPVSNFPFLSKVLEKVAASQLTSYLQQRQLFSHCSLLTEKRIQQRPHYSR